MRTHTQNIRCLGWLALAALVVARLDAQSADVRRSLPRIEVAALADSRSQIGRVDSVPLRQFEGFVMPQELRDSIVNVALSQLGRRYVFGGTTPSRGFDCSGLVRYVLAHVDLPLPRIAAQQARVGAEVDRELLQPGDLLAFGEADTVSHIGIYIGDGQYVHASSVAGKVIVSPVERPASRLIPPLKGARRLLAVAETPGRRRS